MRNTNGSDYFSVGNRFEIDNGSKYILTAVYIDNSNHIQLHSLYNGCPMKPPVKVSNIHHITLKELKETIGLCNNCQTFGFYENIKII